jgi:hypothetical protein
MFLVIVWWLVSAHKWFKGPKVNVEHAIHEREVVEGIEHSSTSDDHSIPDKKADLASGSAPPSTELR